MREIHIELFLGGFVVVSSIGKGFKKFPGSPDQPGRGVALSFVYRRLCSSLPRKFLKHLVHIPRFAAVVSTLALHTIHARKV